jgi:hypothetical protein
MDADEGAPICAHLRDLRMVFLSGLGYQTRAVALAVATLPPTLFWVMGTRYFGALPFQVATVIVCLASLTLLAAAFWPTARDDGS